MSACERSQKHKNLFFFSHLKSFRANLHVTNQIFTSVPFFPFHMFCPALPSAGDGQHLQSLSSAGATNPGQITRGLALLLLQTA